MGNILACQWLLNLRQPVSEDGAQLFKGKRFAEVIIHTRCDTPFPVAL